MAINTLLLTITLACVPALGLLETSTSIIPFDALLREHFCGEDRARKEEAGLRRCVLGKKF